MRRMLDPKEAGGSLPSTITFDQEGNRTASKDLGVDGKLTLKSLVSASNPDGDITKELGGGGGGGGSATARHGYSIFVQGNFHYEVYTTKDYGWEIGKNNYIDDFKSNDNYKELCHTGIYPASGIWYNSDGSKKKIIVQFEITASKNFYISGYDIAKGSFSTDGISTNVFSVIKLY